MDFVTARRGGGKRIRRRIVVGEGGQVIVDVRKAARHGRETPQTGVGAGETGIGGQTPPVGDGKVVRGGNSLGHLPFRRGAGAEVDGHDPERFSAMGAAHCGRKRATGRRRAGSGVCGGRCAGEELAGVFQPLAQAMVEEAEVADNPLALGGNVDQEATQELLCGQIERRAGMVCGALVGDGQRAAVIVLDPGLADGAAAQVGAQIADGAAGMLVGRLDLDMPLLASSLVEQGSPGGGVGAGRELQSAFRQGGEQKGAEPAAELGAEGTGWAEEGVPAFHPLAGGVQPPGSDQDMQVDVEVEGVAPALDHARGAGGCAQPAGVVSKGLERIPGRVEQQVGEGRPVIAPQRVNAVGKGEDNLVVGARQGARLLLAHPLVRLAGAADGATAVLAGVEPRGLIIARLATGDVIALGLGPTGLELLGRPGFAPRQLPALLVRAEMIPEDLPNNSTAHPAPPVASCRTLPCRPSVLNGSYIILISMALITPQSVRSEAGESVERFAS